VEVDDTQGEETARDLGWEVGSKVEALGGRDS
jgi:hypothetical protein